MSEEASLGMGVPCPDCANADGHQSDPRGCAFCRGRADFPCYKPKPKEEDRAAH